MIRLAILSLLLVLSMAALSASGLAGDYSWLVKVSFLGLLVLFIVSAAASAWQSKP